MFYPVTRCLEALVNEQSSVIGCNTKFVPLSPCHRHQENPVVGSERFAGVEINRWQSLGIAAARRHGLTPLGAESNSSTHKISHRFLHGDFDLLPFSCS